MNMRNNDRKLMAEVNLQQNIMIGVTKTVVKQHFYFTNYFVEKDEL